MTQKRQEQFNIKSRGMPDDVYRVFEQKAANRQLKAYLIRLVQKDINESQPGCSEILNELKRIETRFMSVLNSRSFTVMNQEYLDKETKVENLQQISTDCVNSALDDDDLGYDF